MNKQLLIGVGVIVAIVVIYYVMKHKSLELYSPSCPLIAEAYIAKIQESYLLLHNNFWYSMRDHNIPESIWRTDPLNSNMDSIINAAAKVGSAIKSGNTERIKGALYFLTNLLNNFEDRIKKTNKSVANAFFHDQQNQLGAELLISGAKNSARQIEFLMSQFKNFCIFIQLLYENNRLFELL
jgi:hypothetical protein